jgi:Cu/Ag efflux protein CusF
MTEDIMKRVLCAAVAVAVLVPFGTGRAAAQDRTMTKTLTGEQKTVSATIESIERKTRVVTLKEENGEYSEVSVPVEVKRFDTLQVGDKITANYYENIVLRLKLPGEKSTDTDTTAITPGTGAKAGATAATQRTITATITAIDPTIPSISFSGPNGWKYSSRVEDKAALAKVKVGDRLDITWTLAVLISAEAPK